MGREVHLQLLVDKANEALRKHEDKCVILTRQDNPCRTCLRLSNAWRAAHNRLANFYRRSGL